MIEEERPNLPAGFLVVLCWFLITQYAGVLTRLFDFRQIHTYLLPAIRMTLLCSVTYAYIRIYEKRGFRSQFLPLIPHLFSASHKMSRRTKLGQGSC
jgi:hypothetical protein